MNRSSTLTLVLTLMVLAMVGFMVSPAALAEEKEVEDTWAPLRPLVGEWTGTGAGGRSHVEAQYGFTLGGKLLEVSHRAVFSPDEKNPDGEIHEDTGFISYGRARDKFVFRQFHIEGFVNQYALDSLSTDGKTLVFISESIENAPPGTRAKLVISISNEDEITTSFHVAWPEQGFQCYSQNNLKRKE